MLQGLGGYRQVHLCSYRSYWTLSDDDVIKVVFLNDFSKALASRLLQSGNLTDLFMHGPMTGRCVTICYG